MDEKIIPEKKLLFQKSPQKKSAPKTPAVKQIQSQQEPKIQFKIPEVPPQNQQQPLEQNIIQEPAIKLSEKKLKWKKWIIIITIIIIIAGLGFYFLSG